MAAAADKKSIGMVTLTNLRLGFPFIYERSPPGKDDDGNERPGNFRASGIMYRTGRYKPFTDKNMALLTKAKEEVLTAKFGADKKKWPKIKADKICVRNGDEENWDGFEGGWYISASEKDQPLLLSRRKNQKGEWEPAKTGELYAGCFVNLIVQLWVQDNKHGIRVNANLKAVQYYGEGDAFSGSAPIDPTQAFLEIEEMDGEDAGEQGFADTDDDDDSVV